MNKQSAICVIPGDSIVCRALLRKLNTAGYTNVASVDGGDGRFLDLNKTKNIFDEQRPEYIFVTGGSSGGISYNEKYPGDLMLDNLKLVCNVISCAQNFRVKKMLYLGSSCMYPRDARQPMHPNQLMGGPLEPSNAGYATAKLAGLEICKAFRKQYGLNAIIAIPANCFGLEDDYSTDHSHVISGLIRKMEEAKNSCAETVTIWGTGAARREFIYSEDLAEACILLMKKFDGDKPINIGTGQVFSIMEVAEKIKKVVGFKGVILNDVNRIDGMPEKSLDSQEIVNLGWRANTSFDDGLVSTYQWYMGQLCGRGNNFLE